MAGEPYEVVVVGNAGIDTNVYLGAAVDLARETEYPEILDTVGQSGGYAARGFGRLGRRVAFLGTVGEDALGQLLLAELAADGVDVGYVQLDPAGTNRSVNLMAPDGRRHGFFDGKSHMTLEPDLDAWRPVLEHARLVHFSIPNWARRLLPLAREAGAVVSVDLQDVHDLADRYRADFLAAADVVFLSGAHLADPRSAVASLCRPGRAIVCGLGARGCAIGAGDGVTLVPAVDVDLPVVDTNGAGDSLAACLLTSYVLEGRALLPDSVRRGQLAARWCCSLRGTSRGLITAAQLDELDDAIRHETPGGGAT